MRNNPAKILSAVIIAMLLVGILPAYAGDPIVPHNGNAMWIEEEVALDGVVDGSISINTDDWKVNDYFYVTVWANITSTIDPSGDVGAWQFKLVYDKSILDATDCDYSEGTHSQFFETINTFSVAPLYGSYNASHDYVQHSELWDPTQPDPNPQLATPAHGALSIVEFQIIDGPEKYSSINSILWLEPVACKVEDAGKNDLIGDPETYDCGYTYTWSPPDTNPHLAVDPDSLLFDKFTNHTDPGTLFDVDLNIENLDAAWKMSNITFNLNYDEALIIPTTVAFNTADFDGTNSFDNTTLGVLGIIARTTQTLSAPPPLTVCTVTFKIIYQDVYPNVNITALTFSDVIIWDTSGEISTPDPDEPGEVTIEGLTVLPFPWMEVVPEEVTLGPGWVVGSTFQVDITINELHEKWYLVGFEFRLSYCPDLLEVVSVDEGPYLPEHGQNPGPPQTFFLVLDNPDGLGTHLLVAGIILPNATTYPPSYTEPLPGAIPPENGTIATITFRVLKQCCWDEYTCDLELFMMKLIDVNGLPIGINDLNVKDGKVTILPFGTLGGQIDVYTQYPSPYGGQGMFMPSDMFWPQKEVILCANVTYNNWPVQQKLVSFIVFDNYGAVWSVLEGVTNEDGVACSSFRIPWPCENPEQYIGVWRVRADVDIACDIYYDEVTFHHDYLMSNTEVETDKLMYEHCEDVIVTVTFCSHMQRTFGPVAMWVTIHDAVNVPIAQAVLIFDIGGAEYCQPKCYEKTFVLHIDKFAFAGLATVYAVPRMYWEGEWVAAGPMGSTEICIIPL